MAANGGFIACDLGTREIAFLRIYSDLQRAGVLFLARPSCQNTGISAAKAMSPADNFLQKQQKQRAPGEERPRRQSTPWGADCATRGPAPPGSSILRRKVANAGTGDTRLPGRARGTR
jgi:hypothetical protein